MKTYICMTLLYNWNGVIEESLGTHTESGVCIARTLKLKAANQSFNRSAVDKIIYFPDKTTYTGMRYSFPWPRGGYRV